MLLSDTRILAACLIFAGSYVVPGGGTCFERFQDASVMKLTVLAIIL